jgi:tRNA (guanine26-N2/guanine27-N2)-dimethyltransferase
VRVASPSHLPSKRYVLILSLSRSALLHAGHQISRSHVTAGSLKTTATREDIHDVYRSWAKLHPVKIDKFGEGSPARRLLAKEPRFALIPRSEMTVRPYPARRAIADFSRHPQSVTPSSKVKLVRYQQNPTPHWGPGTKAVSGTGNKRKRAHEEV